jgi:type VI protein secretion system component VasF
MDDEASAWASGADTNFDPNQAVHDLQKVLAPGEHLVHSAKAHAWAGRVAFWLLLAGLLAAAVAVMIWLMPHISSDAASELSLHKITYRKVYPRK